MDNFEKIDSLGKVIDILRNFTGQNPYIQGLKRAVLSNGNTSHLTDFAMEYVLSNADYPQRQICKTVEITDWYGEVLKKNFSIEFVPKKIHIFSILGETKAFYHIVFKYRQNMEPMLMFVPKKAICEDFLLTDFHDVFFDPSRYNNLMHLKNPDRNMKPHQEEAVQFLLSRKKCILADDMGLGKSLELSVAAIEGNFDSVLIICPASLKTNWKDELMWFVPEKDISVIEGFTGKNKKELEKHLGYGEGKSGKNRQELMEEAKSLGKWKENRFVIVNYDILDEFYQPIKARTPETIRKKGSEYPLFGYLYGKKSLIIIDEAHELSNSTSDRYKLIKNLIGKTSPDSIYLSTGTPITNEPSNYYNLLSLIGHHVADDYEYYVNRYCGAMKIPAKGEKDKWKAKYYQLCKKPGWSSLTEAEKNGLKPYIMSHARLITILRDPSNLDELRNRTAGVYLRRVKEDLSELPMKKIHEIRYDFTMEQMSEYDRLWEEYEQMKKEENPEKEINKELIEGAIYRKYCSNAMIPHTQKLVDWYIERGEKVVVACCYDEELYTLRDYYGDKCVIFNGKMSLKEKDIARKAFLDDPTKMVFIGNIASCGAGITLISSHVMVFNNFDYTYALNAQMTDRIYRIGQKKDVDIYYQMFKGTQYEKMWDINLRKKTISTTVIKKEDEK